ncbi:MAG: FtsW/RodA/SpoVE family cell cycle protein [Bacilli bacterium]|nr:FtsW/RodA/SpoVE family cell cycle protein [Bacilli bacterium]
MRKLFSKLDKPLLIITIIFFIFGLIMILSASSMESFMRYEYSPYHYFFRQLIFLIIGFIGFLFVIIFPTKNYKKLDKFFLIIIFLMLGGLLVYGYAANNAVSWYKIGPITIQPSEFAKIAIIIYLAVYYEKNKDNLDNQWNIIKPILFIIIITALVAIQPDMGTALIIMLITLIVFYGVPINKKNRSIFNKIFIGGIIIVTLVLVTAGSKFLKSYQLERFNFIDPCERYQDDSGYQLCNSFIAFKNGNINGQGLGSSTQKYLYLPESYTDFIFPIIVEEWGLIVGIIILFCYMFVLFRIIRLARRANNLRNSLICYGVFAYLLTHIIVNLGGVMGLIPLTGVPLPFLSYGGSYAICLMISLGLVQRVSIESKKVNKEK